MAHSQNLALCYIYPVDSGQLKSYLAFKVNHMSTKLQAPDLIHNAV